MDATKRVLGSRGRRRLATLLVAAASLVSATMRVDAAPMRGRARLVAQKLRASNTFQSPALSPTWNSFLGMGPNGWGAYQSPAFTVPTRLAVWRMLEAAPRSIGLDPMLEYLIWRRDLNAARFDYFHPRLGPRLGQLLVPPPLPPPLVIPPEEAGLTPPPQLVVPDNPVPEPAGWILAALASAWGLWRRMRSRVIPAR